MKSCLLYTSRVLAEEIDIAEIEKDIDKKLYVRIGEQQRANILREQMNVIRAELGYEHDSDNELDEYRDKILSLALDDEVEDVYKRQGQDCSVGGGI